MLNTLNEKTNGLINVQKNNEKQICNTSTTTELQTPDLGQAPTYKMRRGLTC